MASARKHYKRSKPEHVGKPANEAFEKACFIADVLDGTIQASAMIEIRHPITGELIRLEFDDPDGGSGAGRGGPAPGDRGPAPARG